MKPRHFLIAKAISGCLSYSDFLTNGPVLYLYMCRRCDEAGSDGDPEAREEAQVYRGDDGSDRVSQDHSSGGTGAS